MAWLPLRLPPHCKFVVSITCEEGKPDTLENLTNLQNLVEAPDHFLLVSALGKDLAWTVMKLWMKNAGRDLNNFQWRVVANGRENKLTASSRSVHTLKDERKSPLVK
jgi:hypothetical protein